MNCPHCGVDHFSAPSGGSVPSGAGGSCPYQGLPYPKLRAGHDRMYFGRWRRMEANPIDMRKALNQLKRLLGDIGAALESEDLPVARKDLDRALEAMHLAELGGGGSEALLSMDHALSFAHRVIGDLLHEKGSPPHSPADFVAWYDAAEIPFREDW